jgi:hypothetical protein
MVLGYRRSGIPGFGVEVVDRLDRGEASGSGLLWVWNGMFWAWGNAVVVPIGVHRWMLIVGAVLCQGESGSGASLGALRQQV